MVEAVRIDHSAPVLVAVWGKFICGVQGPWDWPLYRNQRERESEREERREWRATRMVSLASESDLGEYKDSEIPRWLVGMLSARGFQIRVLLLQILSVTLLVGDYWGLGRVILTIGLLLNIPLLIKIT